MIVAIMQPYFFPYIGYFQLMHSVDTFVFFDDVQYIERGWVNRNLISISGKANWLTMPVRKDLRNLSINQRHFFLTDGADSTRRRLQAAYPRPKWQQEFCVIDNLLKCPETNVALFNANLLQVLAGRLSITCNFETSSKILGPNKLRGQEKIIEICRILGASHYINTIGGMLLYDSSRFADAGLRLSFLRTTVQPTRTDTGCVHFSMIDTMISLGFEACRALLPNYEQLDGL